MDLVLKELKLKFITVPPLLQIAILEKSIEKTNFVIALEEWEWIVGKINSTTNDQIGACVDYGVDKNGSCICGEPVRWGYKIKNKLNGTIIPEDITTDECIGCICLESFFNNVSKVLKKLRKQRNETMLEYKINMNPYDYCRKHKIHLRGQPTCRQCIHDIEGCQIIDCKRKLFKFNMCKTCCKERKLVY